MGRHPSDSSLIRKTKVFHWLGLLMCVGAVCLLLSCDGNVLEGISDDDSYDARLEEGLIALDDEKYSKAVDLFVDLRSDYPDKEEVCVYLSNAYAGLTGIDTFNFLETIDELEETDNEGSIDMIGLLLGDASGEITQTQVDSKLDSLLLAQNAMSDCIENPNTDEKAQSGLLGVSDAALIIADMVMADTGTTSVVLTEEALEALYESRPEFDEGDISDEDLERLNEAMDAIADSVEALEAITEEDEENDLSDSFDEFLSDLDPEGDGVTRDDLETYIDNL